MATGLTFRDGSPAQMARGKYQTRNQRIAEITASRIVSGESNGIPFTKTMWDGNLLMSDCKTVDTAATWSDDGHYLHQEGVQSPFDLCLVVTQEAPAPVECVPVVPPLHASIPEPPAIPNPPAGSDPAVLEHMVILAAITKEIEEYREGSENDLQTVQRLLYERVCYSEALTEVTTERDALRSQLAQMADVISERDRARAQVAELLAKPATA